MLRHVLVSAQPHRQAEGTSLLQFIYCFVIIWGCWLINWLVKGSEPLGPLFRPLEEALPEGQEISEKSKENCAVLPTPLLWLFLRLLHLAAGVGAPRAGTGSVPDAHTESPGGTRRLPSPCPAQPSVGPSGAACKSGIEQMLSSVTAFQAGHVAIRCKGV